MVSHQVVFVNLLSAYVCGPITTPCQFTLPAFHFTSPSNFCLAALNKMELLPWDAWGPMTFRRDPDPDQATLVDEIAAIIATDDVTSIRLLYESDAGLAVPATVYDGRFGVAHPIGPEGHPSG